MPFDDRNRLLLVAGISLLLVLVGTGMAAWAQTAGGDVELQDVTIEAEDGTEIDGALYVPETASSDNPAPGVLAVHGYINSKETQSSFAIEYARRGYVVLAIDQTGHGYSDPPAFANGWGGPPALAYLSEHELVDEENIALEGHSMGGAAVLAAADEHPESYESVVLAGAATGALGAPEGTGEFPRNLGVVFAEYDEFHSLMWETDTAPETPESETLQTVFRTDGPVDVGTTYGSIDDGTARQLTMPGTTHPGTHHSTEAVADAIEWTQRTTEGGSALDPDDQIWYWKEIGTAVALFGGFGLLLSVVGLVSGIGAVSTARRTLPEAVSERDRSWYISAVLTVAVPVLTYYPTMLIGSELLPVTPITPQGETNGIVLWAIVNTLVIVGLLGRWHRNSDRELLEQRYGLDPGEGRETIVASVSIALAAAGALFVVLFLVATVAAVDFRAWILALKPPSLLQVGISLVYLPWLLAFFLALSVLIHGRLRTPETTNSLPKAIGTNVGLLAGGFALLILFQYVWLFATGALPIPLFALWTIIGIQFVGVLAIAGVVSTYCFHRTGRIWVGSVLNAVWVTWLVVASQATHYAFF